MIHLLGRDPDHIICHVLQAQVRIPAAEIAIQKILSKIYRSLHTDIIANNILFGIKKCVKKQTSPPIKKSGQFKGKNWNFFRLTDSLLTGQNITV